MSSVVVIGAGPGGLATAMLLAEGGLEVTVLEKDANAVPDSLIDAWTSWKRPGVAQFRQSHGLVSRGLQILESRLPRVVAHMKRLGAHPFTMVDAQPPSMREWTPEPEDSRFDSLGASRPLYELAFALAAEETPNVEVRRGVQVAGLTTGAEVVPNVPQITGVVTDGGDTIRADLVIDAGGRRSPMPAFLEDIGARRPPQSDGDFRFVYYTRYYRKAGTELPEPYVLARYLSGSISIGTFPADNDTWSVTVYGTNSDKALRSLKEPETFDKVIRAHPERAHFIEGEPISDVLTMAGVADRERSLLSEGQPVATGWVPVADAWACTNPILGRGITMGLMHAAALTPALLQSLERPAELSDAWESITEEHVRPWYVHTRDVDRARSQEMDAVRTGKISRHGEQLTPDAAAFMAAVLTDAVVFRAQLEVAMLLTKPDEVMSRTEVQSRVADAAKDMPDLPPPPVPTRAELETLLA